MRNIRSIAVYRPTLRLKNEAKLFSSELRQIFADFDNFWHKNDQDDKIA